MWTERFYSILLKDSFLWAVTTKNEIKLTKTEKTCKKENNTDESDFSENEIPDINGLKPFEFGPKTNILEMLTLLAVIMRKKVLNIKQIG